MPEKQRQLLLNINEQIKKLNTPPPPTFSPKTGEVTPPPEYQSLTNPLVTLPPPQSQR